MSFGSQGSGPSAPGSQNAPFGPASGTDSESFNHELDRATHGRRTRSHPIESGEREKGSRPHRLTATRLRVASLAPSPSSLSAGSGNGQSGPEAPELAGGLAHAGNMRSIEARLGDHTGRAGEVAGEPMALGSSACASPTAPFGSLQEGDKLLEDHSEECAGPQESGEASAESGAGPTSDLSTEGSSPALEGVDVDQPQSGAAASPPDPSGNASPPISAGAQSNGTYPAEPENGVAGALSFTLPGEPETSGAGFHSSAAPEHAATSLSKDADQLVGDSLRPHPTAAADGSGTPRAVDSASIALTSVPSVSANSSGDNKFSSDSKKGDQHSPDSGHTNHSRTDSAPEISSLPQTFTVPAQPAPASTPAVLAPQASSQPPAPNPAANALDAWGELAALRARIVTSAGLYGGADHAEMRVQLRTEALGAMELRAFLQGDRVGAAIGVQTPEAHSLLVTELPALHQALANQNLSLANVSIVDSGGTHGSSNETSGGQAGSGSSSDLEPRSSVGPIRSGPQSANGANANVEVETWYSDGLARRLSVRV
jgi:hypothetical protein